VRYIYENPHKITLHRVQARLSVTQAAELAGVSRRTWKKWEHSEEIPLVVLELIKARSGTIWDGWTYWDGVLTDYAGREYREGDLMAAYYALLSVGQDGISFLSRARGNLERTSKIDSGGKVNRAEPIAVPDFDKKQRSLGF